jgi:hypothetical protein
LGFGGVFVAELGLFAVELGFVELLDDGAFAAPVEPWACAKTISASLGESSDSENSIPSPPTVKAVSKRTQAAEIAMVLSSYRKCQDSSGISRIGYSESST